jgi:glycosyltransferase involved in cell wall biosynthesis
MAVKALVVTPNYPVPDNPQSGIFIHRQVMNLIRQGVDCRVLVYRPAPPPFPLWLRRRAWLRYYWRRLGWSREIDGVPVEVVFYRRRWEKGEDVVPAIGEAIVNFVSSHTDYLGADVVYAHFLWTAGAAALSLRERFGWPLVAIARGSEMHEWQELYPHCRTWVETVLREADCALANCEDLRDRAMKLVPSRQPGVIYNGCDAERFRPALDKAEVKRKLGLGGAARVAVFCGAVEARKGVRELAEAWGQFSAAHPEWKLIILGRIVESELASKLKELSNGSVLFVGQMPQQQVIQYLQSADAYVQPSHLEGLANATMEAMAVGLPVITTDTCGQSELIEDGVNGWLIPPRDAAALERALETMASDREGALRCGRAARQTIKSQFNPEREAQKLARLLAITAARSERRSVAAGRRDIGSAD